MTSQLESEKFKKILEQHEKGKQQRAAYYKRRYQSDDEYREKRKAYNNAYYKQNRQKIIQRRKDKQLEELLKYAKSMGLGKQNN